MADPRASFWLKWLPAQLENPSVWSARDLEDPWHTQPSLKHLRTHCGTMTWHTDSAKDQNRFPRLPQWHNSGSNLPMPQPFAATACMKPGWRRLPRKCPHLPSPDWFAVALGGWPGVWRAISCASGGGVGLAPGRIPPKFCWWRRWIPCSLHSFPGGTPHPQWPGRQAKFFLMLVRLKPETKLPISGDPNETERSTSS